LTGKNWEHECGTLLEAALFLIADRHGVSHPAVVECARFLLLQAMATSAKSDALRPSHQDDRVGKLATPREGRKWRKDMARRLANSTCT
jgi:hypothetical protein